MLLLWLSLLSGIGVHEYVFLHTAAYIYYDTYGGSGLQVAAGVGNVAAKWMHSGGVMHSDTFGVFFGECQASANPPYACQAVSPKYAGTQFAYTPRRGFKHLFYISPKGENATFKAEFYSATTFLSTVFSGHTVERGSLKAYALDVRGKVVVITATEGEIYVAHSAEDNEANPVARDYFVLAPAAPVIYGVISQMAGIATVGTPSGLIIECDDGTTQTRGTSNIHQLAEWVKKFVGPACRFSSQNGVALGGIVVADGDGGDGIAMHSRGMFGAFSYLPKTNVLKLVSDSPGSCLVGAMTLNLVGTGGAVYSARTTAVMPAGIAIECDVEVMAIANVMQLRSTRNDEINLLMHPMTQAPTVSPTLS
eukprot:Hpha_TRINITY_DN15709_c1_g1::TRINITY_DN15709_c1_g1_i1::g.37270::m.37270